jgi:hypothetical protein
MYNSVAYDLNRRFRLLCPNVFPVYELLHLVYVTLILDVSGTARISEISVTTVTSTKSEFTLTV